MAVSLRADHKDAAKAAKGRKIRRGPSDLGPITASESGINQVEQRLSLSLSLSRESLKTLAQSGVGIELIAVFVKVQERAATDVERAA